MYRSKYTITVEDIQYSSLKMLATDRKFSIPESNIQHENSMKSKCL